MGHFALLYPDPAGQDQCGFMRIRIQIHITAKLSIPSLHLLDTRVLSLFSSSPNWDSSTPSHAGECVPPPLGSGGGGAHSLAEEGLGVPIPTRDRHGGTQGIYVLCVLRWNSWTFFKQKALVCRSMLFTVPSTGGF